MDPLSLFWRVFSRIMRFHLVAVGIVFVGVGVVSGLLWLTQAGWQPATGVVVSAVRSGSGYDSMVRVTRDGVTTMVPMELIRTKFGAPKPGTTLSLVQNPKRPTDVAMAVAANDRAPPTFGFLGGGLLMVWLGFGARMPRRRQPVFVPVPQRTAAATYAWQQTPEPTYQATARPAAVIDNSRARLQTAAADNRRTFGRRGT
jgi:hypothetical protein